MMDDRDALLDMINASWTTQVVRTACLLGLPDGLAIGGPGGHSLAQLAASTHTHAPSLRRLLRAMATLGLCVETAEAKYHATAMGGLLCANEPRSLRAWALLAGGPHWHRWGELAESVRTGQSHKQRHFGEDGFGDLDHDPDAASTFHEAMAQMTRRVAPAIADALPLSGAGRIVDVGGGQGELLAGVLRRHPAWHGVVFDLPTGTRHARALLQQAGISGRWEVVAGDFFEEPPPAGDVYLLKSVLHNWDDDRCVRILRACREAMPVDGRVVVVERLMAALPGPAPMDRATARSDLNMLVALTGRERTRTEFAALFTAAGLCVPEVTATRCEFALVSASAA